MCETMMSFGFDKEVSYRYISEIAKIIEPLSPAVVYLKNDNIGEIIRQTAARITAAKTEQGRKYYDRAVLGGFFARHRQSARHKIHSVLSF